MSPGKSISPPTGQNQSLFPTAPNGSVFGEGQQPRNAWAERCPKCGARPGESCRVPSGGATKDHRARQRLATYRPVG